MNGSCLIELVYVSLNADDNAFNKVAEFCEKNVHVDVISSVVTYIT